MEILKSFLFANLMTCFFYLPSFASNDVTFKGVVFESVCIISPDNIYQIIDIGNLSVRDIKINKKSKAYPINIKLKNCFLGNKKEDAHKYIDVTFLGLDKANGILHEKGLKLIIEDIQGDLIYPGVTRNKNLITDGNNILRYKFYLKNEGLEIISGDFNVNFIVMLGYL